jgi:hypothetical protein
MRSQGRVKDDLHVFILRRMTIDRSLKRFEHYVRYRVAAQVVASRAVLSSTELVS